MHIMFHFVYLGYTAYRHEDEGSTFVNAIADVFEEHAFQEDILSLSTKVSMCY